MKRKERRKLEQVLTQLMKRGAFVCLDRKPLDPSKLQGFIVGVSQRLVMLHVVDGSTVELNGYSVVRLKDLRAVSTPRSFIPRALELQGHRAEPPPGLDLTNWISLLTTARITYPLVWLESEKQRPGCGYVGQCKKITPKTVHLRDVDCRGQWNGSERYQLRQITQVTLGGGYVKALWTVLTDG